MWRHICPVETAVVAEYTRGGKVGGFNIVAYAAVCMWIVIFVGAVFSTIGIARHWRAHGGAIFYAVLGPILSNATHAA
jgi:hypothetical protein